MADSRPSTADEKFEATAAAPHKHGFFSRKKPSTTQDDNINEKGGNITEVKPTVPELAPVSFSQLFRSVNFLWYFLDSVLTL